MAKQGVLHDYDIHANYEESARNQNCIVCGDSPMAFQWSDYSGEGMCMKCGTPYQLKWGSDKQGEEGNYPYLNMREDFVPIAKEYWRERQTFVCYGTMVGPKPGMTDLIEWLKENHPDQLKKS